MIDGASSIEWIPMTANGPILVINCGSSSVKFALFADARDAPRRLVSGVLERIGLPAGSFRTKDQDGGVLFDETHDIPNHVAALDLLLSKVEKLVPHGRIRIPQERNSNIFGSSWTRSPGGPQATPL